MRIVYRATCPAPTDPVVHDVGGTTADARWVDPAGAGALPLTPGWRAVLVALSLLPIRCRRRVGALLHEGRPPGAILELAIAECLPQARPAPDALPSTAQLAKRLARPDEPLEKIEEYYGAGYAARLY